MEAIKEALFTIELIAISIISLLVNNGVFDALNEVSMIRESFILWYN